jgi:dTDP-4-amino-4,6-dideoxygalactose transaminase
MHGAPRRHEESIVFSPMTKTIRFNEPYLTGRERAYIETLFEGGSFQGNGEFTRKAQSLLETRYGASKVLLTHSCTAALEMSALLLDLTSKDEVIIPSYTFCSTASAFARTPARIAFCEIDPQTMMIDVADAERRITKNTRAIVPVHYGGLACDIADLMALADSRDITVVEDAAQGLNAFYDGRALGRFGALGCFSFHETKNLHAGLAGALFINESMEPEIERAIRIWERGTNRQAQLRGLVDKYTWTDIGSSFYPTELQAAFLLAQLEDIDENMAQRRRIHEAYEETLTPIAARGAFKLPLASDRVRRNYHAYYLIFNSAEDCERVRLALKAQSIDAYIGYVPLHSSPMGQKLGWRPEDLPVTEEMAPRVLRLPFHNGMEPDDARRVAAVIAAQFEG